MKKPSASYVVKSEVVCPHDTNPMGILKGGRLVEWMDMAAAVCAQTHAGKICVTASINHVGFNEVARIGDLVTVSARVTRTFNTSMEIFLQAFARKVTSRKKSLISEAFFTFVALDEDGKSSPVIAVRPTTSIEKRLYLSALDRREKTFQERKKRTAC